MKPNRRRPTVTVSLVIREDQRARMQTIADARNLSLADVAREVIDAGLTHDSSKYTGVA